ncbi:hypothetical protein ACFYV7_40460 [Nocardia suismassiliense]|uniref:Uncharacterized protein n=1 Tax=Nocardia suismassiliense TaxID=2077092 RepID=A0ABW6R6G5_9NOCA
MFDEVLSAALTGGGWTVVIVQMLLLVRGLAVVVVAALALRLADKQDVPTIFEAFTAASVRRNLGRRRGAPRTLVSKSSTTEDNV